MNLIVGINCHAHDSAAAVIADGRLVFAAAEERFSRIRKDRAFPRAALARGLAHVGASAEDVDAVAFGWNAPGRGPIHMVRKGLTGGLHPDYVLTQPYHVARELRDRNGIAQLLAAFPGMSRAPTVHVDHHAAHAWSAVALCGWEEATVIVADGYGAWQATSVYHARGDDLEALRVFPHPNSLGLFYESFTDLLGFERNSDEWKVMGLAAYGRPTVDLRRYGVVTADGYRVNGRLLSGHRSRPLHYLTQEMGPRRDPEAELTDRERDIAASVQVYTEEALMAVARDAVRRTGCRRLCLAGGVAMNSKANGRLLASGIVDEVFVQPAATDDGTAVGAGFAALLPLGRSVGRARLTDVYLGPELTDEEIVRTLDTCKVPYTVSEGAPEIAARLIADGNVVAWVQGRMEFGPRALGNRSILGDPRHASTRDRINESVKYREPWRPFAPSCLSETMGEYFTPAAASPFMILCFDVLDDRRPVIPAVVHADNTSRVQTVDRNQNPPYRRLIEEFARLTGVPVVVNTSLNLRGEPIVCTPRDALRTFWSSGMDYLVMGSCVVAKSPEGMEQIRRLVTGETVVAGSH